jgi:hypothetical protein
VNCESYVRRDEKREVSIYNMNDSKIKILYAEGVEKRRKMGYTRDE